MAEEGILKELFDLSGKVALVTGAARGLGRVQAEALARAGADLAVCDLKREDVEPVAAAIQKLGRQAAAFGLDVSSKPAVDRGAAEILARFGRVDILVNNAGVNYRVPVLELPEAEWDRIIDTNLKGCFLVAQALAPQMIERGYGKIINISSVMGTVALPTRAAYCASKGGVDQLTKVMALEWARTGVRVNAIGPTFFATELVKQLQQDRDWFNFINERTPMGRFGEPGEIAGLVIFLASPASDFITGQTIYIDGGWTAW